jgi:Mrp family chromosome partitioning ATPase
MSLTSDALKKLQQSGAFPTDAARPAQERPPVSASPEPSESLLPELDQNLDPLPEDEQIASEDELEEAWRELAALVEAHDAQWEIQQVLERDDAWDGVPELPAASEIVDDAEQPLEPPPHELNSDRQILPLSDQDTHATDDTIEGRPLPEQAMIDREQLADAGFEPVLTSLDDPTDWDSAPESTPIIAAAEDGIHSTTEPDSFDRLPDTEGPDMDTDTDPAAESAAEAGPVAGATTFAPRLEQLRSSSACRAEVSDIIDRLAELNPTGPVQVLLLTSVADSPRNADALGLMACEYVARGEKVLLVDGDLAQQQLTRACGQLGEPGLCDVLSGSCPWDQAVRQAPIVNVGLVPCGDDVLGISREPALLSESSLRDAVQCWLQCFDRVLIDAGACNSALLESLGRCSEVTVLLVPCESDTSPGLSEASAHLSQVVTNLIGCLLTDFPRTAAS